MLTEEVKNELLVLESVYCRPGEFTRLDSDTVRLKLAEETFLTVSVGMETGYPASPPALSLAAAALPRARAHTLTQELVQFAGGLEVGQAGQVGEVLEFARERLAGVRLAEKREAGAVVVPDRELAILRLDHMRNTAQYLKQIERWAGELGVLVLLVTARDAGLVFLLRGDKLSVSQLISNWKSVNVDVDSRGRGCRERLLQILHRGPDPVSQAPGRPVSDWLTVVHTARLLDHFAGSELQQTVAEAVKW